MERKGHIVSTSSRQSTKIANYGYRFQSFRYSQMVINDKIGCLADSSDQGLYRLRANSTMQRRNANATLYPGIRKAVTEHWLGIALLNYVIGKLKVSGILSQRDRNRR